MSNETLNPRAYAETVVHAGREVLRHVPEFTLDYLKHHPLSSLTITATGVGVRLGMADIEPGWIIAGAGVVASPILMLAESAVDIYVSRHRKRITKLDSLTVDQDTTGLDKRDVERGRIVRQDLLRVIEEFVPQEYLSRGVTLNQDGDGYWGKEVHNNFINRSSSDYDFNLSARMGEENGQPYTASVNYNLRWEPVEIFLRAGTVPAFITPAHLPKPIPGFTWLHIPPESIREVAEMVYDLPRSKTWESSSIRTYVYMSNEERDFAQEVAKGKTFDGRKFDLAIDEQSFSRLRVVLN